MDDEYLREIAELFRETTKGPYTLTDRALYGTGPNGARIEIARKPPYALFGKAAKAKAFAADMRLHIEARSIIPDLLEEIDRLERLIHQRQAEKQIK